MKVRPAGYDEWRCQGRRCPSAGRCRWRRVRRTRHALLLEFLHVESHLSRQPTGTGTQSYSIPTAKHPKRNRCFATHRLDRQNGRWNERLRPCPHRRRATRALGPRQGAEVRACSKALKETNVPRRHRENPRRPEGALGEVAESAQGLETQARNSIRQAGALRRLGFAVSRVRRDSLPWCGFTSMRKA
jgi:hypothetical protein